MNENDPLAPAPPATAETAPAALSKDEKTWGMIGHLSALAGCLVPFGSVIAPLIVWQMKKAELPFAAEQAKEALNFQISVFLYAVVSFFLCFVIIGFLVLPALLIGALVLTIMAGIKANDGIAYRYPLTLRLVK